MKNHHIESGQGNPTEGVPRAITDKVISANSPAWYSFVSSCSTLYQEGAVWSVEHSRSDDTLLSRSDHKRHCNFPITYLVTCSSSC